MGSQILFRTDDGIKRLATARAKRSGVPLSKVLGALLSAYAAGKLEVSVDVSVRDVGSAELKSREEMKAMTRDEWKSYVSSLTEEQREALWRRDDAPYVTENTIKALSAELSAIEKGETEPFGPFESVDAMNREMGYKARK